MRFLAGGRGEGREPCTAGKRASELTWNFWSFCAARTMRSTSAAPIWFFTSSLSYVAEMKNWFSAVQKPTSAWSSEERGRDGERKPTDVDKVLRLTDELDVCRNESAPSLSRVQCGGGGSFGSLSLPLEGED